MKRVTASEARRNWFRLLDEAVDGEVVVIERAGTRILLQREPGPAGAEAAPDYADLIRAPDVAGADRWSWEWDPEEGDLVASDPDSE
ncbi:MAG: hypothetical protein PVJ80_16650 [Gemmatimonadota bacterium]|jgi:hypothetical protein